MANTRWKCPHCGASGWDSPGQKVSGLFDHDRPDGRRCQRAAKKHMPNPREPRYAIMWSDDRPGHHIVWAQVSPNPDVSFRTSSGGFYDIPEEEKRAIPWAIESAMLHKKKSHVPNAKTRTSAVQGRSRAVGRLDAAVLKHARSSRGTLRPGMKVDRYTITEVGTHTVVYKTHDGYTGSVQIPFIDPDTGEQTPAHRRALAEFWPNSSDATEFARRRSLPGVQVRHMKAGRTFDVVLSLGGRDIGGKHETTTRGKVTQTHYVLPPLEGDVRNMQRNSSDAKLTPIANPGEVEFFEDNRYVREGPLWLLTFGAYGDTKVYIWADGVESAFEEGVEWLDDNAPGLLTNMGLDEYKQAAEELDIPWNDDWPDFEDEQFEKVVQHAEVDMTMIGHTTLKHGNAIPSYEWFVNEVERGSEEWDQVVERSYEESED